MENTLKLLLRCKLAFYARSKLIEIFELILSYESLLKQAKEMLAE